LSAFIIAGVFACKKESNTPEPPERLGDCIGNDKKDTTYTEIPNLGFEEWYLGQGNKYLDPLPCNFWTTPNQATLMEIGNIKPPITVFRVGKDSAYSGNYAAMLVSQKGVLPIHQVTAATIASGVFKVDLNDVLNTLKFGRPFHRRPKTVSGYYKYFPVSGDSASVYCFVTKGKGATLDTIGFGRKLFYDQQETYSKFEFDLEYKSEDTPENIVIYFSSSEAGDEFKGRPGNTVFFDDISVTYHD
jgi:hypothetical protein